VASYSVSGTVAFHKSGDIYVEFITPEGSTLQPPAGLQLAVKEKSGKVSFKFDQVPSGRYALQAFRDTNGNGKLDFGAVGPKEPWGFYRNVRPLLRGPGFDEIAFEVNRDLVVDLEVK